MNKRNKFIVLCLLICAVSTASCSSNNIISTSNDLLELYNSSSPLPISTVAQPDVTEPEVSIPDDYYPKVIEDEKYYKIVEVDNFQYHYYIYDSDKNAAKEEGTNGREPSISMINDSIVFFYIQFGTGPLTGYSYFYDVKNNVFSDKFGCTYDATAELLIYYSDQKIIVRNIFDKTKYYKEISEFKNISKNQHLPSSIRSACFNEAGNKVIIEYLTDDDFTTTTITVDLYQ